MWIVAHQAPPSMGFSRQEYWSGLPGESHGQFMTDRWLIVMTDRWLIQIMIKIGKLKVQPETFKEPLGNNIK